MTLNVPPRFTHRLIVIVRYEMKHGMICITLLNNDVLRCTLSIVYQARSSLLSFKSYRKSLDIAILMIFCSHKLYQNIIEALQGDEVLREVEEE